MIPAEEMADMRSTAEDWMPDTVDVYVATETSDGMGGSTTNWEVDPFQTAVPCRVVIPRAFQEFAVAGQVQGGGSYTISFQHDTVIDPNARLLYKGDWLEIEQPLEPRSHEVQRVYTARRIN